MNVKHELERVGSILQGYHFRYQSKKHGPNYINIDPLIPETLVLWKLGYWLVAPFLGRFDVIASPATGGIPLGDAAAFQALNRGGEINMVFCEKNEAGDLVFDRATFADRVKGKAVLVIDDIMSNANKLGTVYRLCRLVESCGGTVIGVSIVCNRCNGTAEQLGVPELNSLMEVGFQMYPAEDCPLCEQAVPIVEDIGHGAEHKAEHPDYPGGYIKLLE